MTGWIDREDETIARATPEVRWRLPDELRAAVLEAVPDLAEPLGRLPDGIPVPRRRAPFKDPPFVRYAGHARSFCVALGDPADGGGHLVFKGTEPLCDDYEEWLDEQRARRIRIEARQQSHFWSDGGVEAEMPLLDKWAVLEGKVPGAYTLAEALGEATAAARLQAAFVTAYGGLARAPVPLLACRSEDGWADRVRRALEPRLSPGAWAVAERGLERGLGVYVYYYPGVPLRLAHLAIGNAEEIGFPSRLAELDEVLDWREVAEGWLDLVARMIALGFLPKAPSSLLSGDCLQFQNVCLDGGIADLDSLIHVDAVTTDRELFDILRRSLLELTKSVATLLLGAPAQQAGFLRRFPDVTTAIGAELHARLRRLGAHPRIESLVRHAGWLDQVEEAFRQAFADTE